LPCLVRSISVLPTTRTAVVPYHPCFSPFDLLFPVFFLTSLSRIAPPLLWRDPTVNGRSGVFIRLAVRPLVDDLLTPLRLFQVPFPLLFFTLKPSRAKPFHPFSPFLPRPTVPMAVPYGPCTGPKAACFIFQVPQQGSFGSFPPVPYFGSKPTFPYGMVTPFLAVFCFVSVLLCFIDAAPRFGLPFLTWPVFPRQRFFNPPFLRSPPLLLCPLPRQFLPY